MGYSDAVHQAIQAEIECRKALGITQKELATLMGTSQANISRFESGEYNPTIAFLTKMAQCMGKTLKISLE